MSDLQQLYDTCVAAKHKIQEAEVALAVSRAMLTQANREYVYTKYDLHGAFTTVWVSFRNGPYQRCVFDSLYDDYGYDRQDKYKPWILVRKLTKDGMPSKAVTHAYDHWKTEAEYAADPSDPKPFTL